MRAVEAGRDGGAMTLDNLVLTAINRLAHEEHHLRRREARQMATDLDRERIAEIEVELDRCWDLLRQRRARRGAGLAADEASARSAATVEQYRQ